MSIALVAPPVAVAPNVSLPPFTAREGNQLTTIRNARRAMCLALQEAGGGGSWAILRSKRLQRCLDLMAEVETLATAHILKLPE